MSTQPGAARVVVIGAGIVGNSLVYHLARLGWKDIVQIEKGPLPEPGRLDRPRLELHLPDRPLARDDGAHRRQRRAVQGDRRLHPERRHRGRPDARADGGAQAPDGVVALVGHRIRAAHARPRSRRWSRTSTPTSSSAASRRPGIGVVDSLRAGTIMRERAQAMGALRLAPMTEVTGIDVEDGRVTRVRTDKGDFEADIVVIACGVWSPRHRRRWPARRSRSRRRSTR